MDCREHQKFHVDGYQVGIPMRGLHRPYAILSRLYQQNMSLDWGHPRSNCRPGSVPTAPRFIPQFWSALLDKSIAVLELPGNQRLRSPRP